MNLQIFIQDQLTGRRNISAVEAAKQLGISRKNLETLVARGFLTPTSGGGSGRPVYFAIEDVEELNERLQEYR